MTYPVKLLYVLLESIFIYNQKIDLYYAFGVLSTIKFTMCCWISVCSIREYCIVQILKFDKFVL